MSSYKYYDAIYEDEYQIEKENRFKDECRKKEYIVTKVEKLEISVMAYSKEEALKMTENLHLTDWLHSSCSNVQVKEE